MTEEYLLEYRFQPGETVRYRQCTYLVLDEPEVGRLMGQTEQRLTQHVVAAQEGFFELDCQLELVSQSGALGEAIPTGLAEQRFPVRMDRHGGLHGDQQRTPSASAAFPAQPMPAGLPWRVGTGPGMETAFQIERFETIDGRPHAHIISQSTMVQADETGAPVRVEVQGYLLFDLETGRLVKSNGVVNSSWDSGKTLQSAVELELLT